MTLAGACSYTNNLSKAIANLILINNNITQSFITNRNNKKHVISSKPIVQYYSSKLQLLYINIAK